MNYQIISTHCWVILIETVDVCLQNFSGKSHRSYSMLETSMVWCSVSVSLFKCHRILKYGHYVVWWKKEKVDALRASIMTFWKTQKKERGIVPLSPWTINSAEKAHRHVCLNMSACLPMHTVVKSRENTNRMAYTANVYRFFAGTLLVNQCTGSQVLLALPLYFWPK